LKNCAKNLFLGKNPEKIFFLPIIQGFPSLEIVKKLLTFSFQACFIFAVRLVIRSIQGLLTEGLKRLKRAPEAIGTGHFPAYYI
jgi:hypothetical protein